MYDPECQGHLPAEALPGLMGALLGAAQRDTAQLFTTASRDDQLTEGKLIFYYILIYVKSIRSLD